MKRAPVTNRKAMGVDWDPFIAVLKEIDRRRADLKFKDGEECFFRGHSRQEYELLPLLFRVDRTLETHLKLEGDLFFEFKARAHELHGEHLSDWDVLFFMRHHGVPTRLLDWTESLGVALYFALHDKDGAQRCDTPCVHLLNPYRLNERGAWRDRDLIHPRYIWYGEDDLDFWDYGDIILEQAGMGWDEPIAIYPEQRSSRVRAQSGWFTLHADDLRPLDRQVKGVTARVDIPPAAVPAAYKFLEAAGLNRYAVFPDLDALAFSVVAKNTPARERLPVNEARMKRRRK